jgi:hypothetical protein
MAFFRYWNFTTCIDFNELDALEREISQLLEQEEGCHRLLQLPQLNCAPEQLRLNYPEAKLPDLWIVGLFEAANDWTVIKTFPTGLLCKRALGAERPRLSYLSERLNCNSFHLEVYEDVGGFLFEADASGHTFLDGCGGAGYPDDFRFYDEEQVDLPDLIQQFSLIDVPESMHEAMKINESPEVKTRQSLIEWLAESPDDADEYYDLILEEPGYTQRIDLALADLIDPERDYWFLKDNLAYKVYNEPQELEAVCARLLYFHPPTSYQPPLDPQIDFSRLSDALPQSEDDLPS